MRRRGGRFHFPIIAMIFGAALLCLCLISVKVLLVVLAGVLILVGIWLCNCC